MAVLVYETDLGVYLNKNADLKNITFKPGESMITIEIDGVSKVQGSNMMLVQEVQDKSWPLVKKEAAALIKALEKADEIKEAPKRKKKVDEELDSFNDLVADKLITLASSVFTTFAKDKKDYKKYKIKAGIKIAVNGLGLAASITLTALAGWTGVGTVVGTVGMIRTTSSLVQQVINLTKDSDGIYKRILGNVVKLKKQLASPNVKANTAKQALSTVANKIFAVEIETIVVTVGGIETDFALLANKIKGNKVNTTSLAGAIPKFLDQQESLKKEIDDLEKLVKLTKKQESELKKLKAAQTKCEQALDKLITNIVTIREKVNEIEAWVTQYHKDIKDLKGKYNPKIVTGVGLATDFLLAAGSFVGGNFSDPAQTVKDLAGGANQLVTSLALANDSFGTVKDIGTSIYDTIKG